MTENDEKKRKLLQSRTAVVTIDRLNQMSIIDRCSVGEILDAIVEKEYNIYVASGKVREHMRALQSMEDDIVK